MEKWSSRDPPSTSVLKRSKCSESRTFCSQDFTWSFSCPGRGLLKRPRSASWRFRREGSAGSPLSKGTGVLAFFARHAGNRFHTDLLLGRNPDSRAGRPNRFLPAGRMGFSFCRHDLEHWRQGHSSFSGKTSSGTSSSGGILQAVSGSRSARLTADPGLSERSTGRRVAGVQEHFRNVSSGNRSGLVPGKRALYSRIPDTRLRSARCARCRSRSACSGACHDLGPPEPGGD